MGDSNAELEMALAVARELYNASERLRQLAFAGTGGAYNYSAPDDSRDGAKAIAVKDWVGGTKDEFESTLYANEWESATDSIAKMRDEADDWAAFWTTTINAREQRDYNAAASIHQGQMQDYEDMVTERMEEDPEGAMYVGSPPIGPPAAKVYTQPNAPYYPNPSI